MLHEGLKILTTGGRDYANAAMVDYALSYYRPRAIVVGDARGADELVRRWAQARAAGIFVQEITI